ncbi:helix-turn-helix domain-containing protein [Peptostreptococcus sp. MV1]|uniref:helix-turn-helix domain-containing protein n=1 Tax=Peptostreptococcus sp. MV1 TaxID=1219626 RepID=UPI0018DEC4BA|nr:helix-turn-helix transcriptional regulator [Peptostreptococcus sp. MV1]
MDFKIKVRTALLEQNKSMKQLSEELGISQAYLSDIVNGNRKADHYRERIMNILKIN